MKINRVTGGLVDKISLVSKPANKSYICSETSCSIDNDTVTVLVLSANDKMYRSQPEERFIYFNEEMVNDLAHSFIENGNTDKLSIDHEDSLSSDIKLQESYVADGEWFVKLKLSSELMGKVKEDIYRGVSIEMKAVEQTVIEITDDIEQFKADVMALNKETKNEIFQGLD